MEEKNKEELQEYKPKFYFDIFEELKNNKNYAKKNSAFHFLKYFLSFTVIIVSTSYLLSINQIWLVLVFIAVTALISAWNSRKHYKELKSLMDILSHIRDLKTRKNPKGKLKEFINTFNMSLEREKLKLDLLKSFSPIPIVVFIIGIIFGANGSSIISLLNTSSPLELGIFSLKTIFLIVITLTLIIYAVFIFNTWDRYKFLQFRGLQYQNAYDELKDLDEK